VGTVEHIASGQTSALIEVGAYCGPPVALRPVVQLNGTGSLTNVSATITNLISAVAYPPVPTSTATQGAAGNVPSGMRTYYVTYVTRHGETTAGPAFTVTLSVASQVALSAIPTSGSPSVTGRNVYRVPAAGGSALLVTNIADNTATTATDNLADAGLGATIPSSDTSTGTRFTVNVLGGTPTSNLPFTWRVR
jgi:hypothetical protein